MSSLDRPLKRVERAKLHLDDLYGEIGRFMETNPYPTTKEPNMERGGYNHRIHVRAELPESIGLIFGDFVHNLRASLDNLVYELAFQNHRKISFPVFSDRAEFKGRFEPLLRSSVLPESFKTIERMQPYHATEPSDPRVRLGLLNEFWNEDKHRTTVPVVLANYIASGGAAYRGEFDVDAAPPFEAYFGDIYDGKIVGWSREDSDVMSQPHFPIHIRFHKKPLVLAESLLDFYDFVRNEVFGVFERS